MDKTLEFKNFAKKNRKYYVADLELKKRDHTNDHTHNFYEFFVVMQGEFKEHFNGMNLILDKQSVHVIKPEDCHSLETMDHYEKSILRNIAIDKDYFEQCLKSVGVEHQEIIFNNFKIDDVSFLNFKTKTNALLHLTASEATNHFLFHNILTDILINGLVQRNNNVDIPNWLQTVYLEISQNRSYVDGIEKLVSLSGKTQEHLTRAFKKYYGITPSDYINDLRLQEVTSNLRTSEDKIIDIVFHSGYNNISYFNRIFRSKYGLTPREYRDNNKKIF
jgi:AraC family cel operon transcriptional repressor